VNKDMIWQVIIGALMIAVIYMLVRPGAPTATAVTDISDALSALIKTATDYQVSPPAGQTQTT
jgi:hypothetical protein